MFFNGLKEDDIYIHLIDCSHGWNTPFDGLAKSHFINSYIYDMGTKRGNYKKLGKLILIDEGNYTVALVYYKLIRGYDAPSLIRNALQQVLMDLKNITEDVCLVYNPDNYFLSKELNLCLLEILSLTGKRIRSIKELPTCR